MTVTEARSGLEAAMRGLFSEKVDGKEYWARGDDPGNAAHDDSSVHLLPAFDEYLLGYKDRTAVLAREDASKIVPGSNGVFRPTIVVGGRVAGTWKRRIKKDAMDLALDPFASPVDWEERALGAARSYSSFVGLPLSSRGIVYDVS